MKEYFRISSTFIMAATLLFCVNRLYEAITSVGLMSVGFMTAYDLSTPEKLTYAASLLFLVVGLTFLRSALKKAGR